MCAKLYDEHRAIEMCTIHLLEEIHVDYNHAIINGKTVEMVNTIVRECMNENKAIEMCIIHHLEQIYVVMHVR